MSTSSWGVRPSRRGDARRASHATSSICRESLTTSSIIVSGEQGYVFGGVSSGVDGKGKVTRSVFNVPGCALTAYFKNIPVKMKRALGRNPNQRGERSSTRLARFQPWRGQTMFQRGRLDLHHTVLSHSPNEHGRGTSTCRSLTLAAASQQSEVSRQSRGTCHSATRIMLEVPSNLSETASVRGVMAFRLPPSSSERSLRKTLTRLVDFHH